MSKLLLTNFGPQKIIFPILNKTNQPRLATLLEGAGYLFSSSSIKIYNLFNFNGEKCVLLANYAVEVLNKLSTINLYKKNEANHSV